MKVGEFLVGSGWNGLERISGVRNTWNLTTLKNLIIGMLFIISQTPINIIYKQFGNPFFEVIIIE